MISLKITEMVIARNEEVYKCLYDTLSSLPDEMVSLIYNYKIKAEKYEEKMKMIEMKQHELKEECMNMIKVMGVTKQIHTMRQEYFERDSIYTFDYEFRVKYDERSYYEDSLKILNSCKCCIIHQTNKPECIDDIEEAHYYRGDRSDWDEECDCGCRIEARNLVEMYHINMDSYYDKYKDAHMHYYTGTGFITEQK